jgi:pyrroline-5-carboxylate reductase
MNNIVIIGNGTIGGGIAKQLNKSYKITILDSKTTDYSLVGKAEVIIIAVKPQQFSELAKQISEFTNDKLIISVMVGKTIDVIKEKLLCRSVVRTMPNIGIRTASSTTAFFSEGLNEQQTRFISEIINLWGKTIELKNESLFDSFAAITGSGPAYFFELANQLEIIAIQNGFSNDEARMMVNATLRASAEQLSSNQSPADKIEAVASKGGITQEALQSLEDNHFSYIIKKAVDAAAKRSREL